MTSANFLKSYVCSDVTYIFRAREAKLQTATWNAKKGSQKSHNFDFFLSVMLLTIRLQHLDIKILTSVFIIHHYISKCPEFISLICSHMWVITHIGETGKMKNHEYIVLLSGINHCVLIMFLCTSISVFSRCAISKIVVTTYI